MHKASNLLFQPVIIRRRIRPRTHIPRRHQARLRLRRLTLLPALLRRLFLLHALVRQRRQPARHLADLVARQLARQLLRELRQEQRVLRLLGVRRQDGHERVAKRAELVFGGGTEERERGEVDGCVGVRLRAAGGVVGGGGGGGGDGRRGGDGDGDGFGDGAFAVEVDVAKEVFGML